MMSKLKLLFALLIISQAALAEDVATFYAGFQSSPHSNVHGTDNYGNSFDFTAEWEGRPVTKSPPYYGLRYTRWYDDNTGLSFDYTHNKVYASDATLKDNGFKTLEFSDGLNTFTLNYMKRYPSTYTPYWGVGAGFTVPHVEIQRDAASPKTFEFQLGGYGVQGLFGFEKAFNKNWKWFLEYKMNYTELDVKIKGGGNLKTNIVANQINLGINYTLSK